jgi:hypothetical protein
MDFVHVNVGSRIDTGISTPNGLGPNPQVGRQSRPTSTRSGEVFFWDGRANNTFDGRTVKNDGRPCRFSQLRRTAP